MIFLLPPLFGPNYNYVCQSLTDTTLVIEDFTSNTIIICPFSKCVEKDEII